MATLGDVSKHPFTRTQLLSNYAPITHDININRIQQLPSMMELLNIYIHIEPTAYMKRTHLSGVPYTPILTPYPLGQQAHTYTVRDRPAGCHKEVGHSSIRSSHLTHTCSVPPDTPGTTMNPFVVISCVGRFSTFGNSRKSGFFFTDSTH